MSQEPSRKRPFGVIAIIVLKIATALLLIIEIIFLIFYDAAGQFLTGLTEDELAVALNNDDLTLMITLTLIVVVLGWHLTLIIGLWLLKRWAWFLTMIQLGLSLALGLWVYAQGEPLYVNMGLNTIMVFYLNQSEVQHAFGQKPKPQQEII
jgi:hypothetical protein